MRTWLADAAYFLVGRSIWILMAVGLREWLVALVRVIRQGGVPVPGAHALIVSNWRFWPGLVMLLSACSALEWTRLYQWEALLPGNHAGGILGYILGGLSQDFLGFTGSGALWIAVLVIGLSMAFGFRWLDVAERL